MMISINKHFSSKRFLIQRKTFYIYKLKSKNKEYYDLDHRKNGPAAKFDDGSLYWIYKGMPHRDDGPSQIVFKNNILCNFEWNFKSKKYCEEEYWNK